MIEVEKTYLTNQPARWVTGRHGRRRCYPDKSQSPTEAYMFTRRKRRQLDGAYWMTRGIETIIGKNTRDLNRKVRAFLLRKDVKIVASR